MDEEDLMQDTLPEEEDMLTEEDNVVEEAGGEGKFTRLLESDARRFKLSGMFRDWFLDYSSYVILDRAVPHIVDGLKPVQRRVLHAMSKMENGSYTKVANIVGNAMQYHPHGDSSILGALVQLGQKGFTVDCQGNWGSILTGDSAAAPRYIEARLTQFAKEVVFDPGITTYMNSYDGRNLEPTELPVRFPLLLAQGADGIAVGMATKILPHNFNELIDASVAILQGKPYEIYPDFPTGGSADCSKYMQGRRGGCVKVRARITKIDRSTISITEIPYGKTTHMLIDSILKAKDKGKIKIKKIDDMTTDHVEINIHLPGDVSPDKTIDALYAFTDCETSISPNACVIVDDKPQFLSVNDVLEYSTFHTRDLLLRQLHLKLDELENSWHATSLEKIFFENRIYKILEQDQKSWEDQIGDVFGNLKQYEGLLHRPITMEDTLKLVEKPVRKISKFDAKAVNEKLASTEASIAEVNGNINNIDAFTVEWFRSLKKKYGKSFPRMTELTGFESIAAAKVVNNNCKLYVNKAEGFAGIGLKKEDGVEFVGECSDLSEIVVILSNGKYCIRKVGEKDFFGKDILYAGVFNRGDERTIYNVIYRDGESSIYYAKRFAITSITRDKEYDVTTGAAGSKIVWFTVNHNGEAESVRIQLRPRAKLKKSSFEYDFSTLAIKGKTSRGNLVTKNPIQKISLKSQGVSTIEGKDIWYDTDIQKLNDEGRGLYLGKFEGSDKVLAIFGNGTFYTTSYELVNKYQGDVLRIEKFDPDLTYTVLYYDGGTKCHYVKRFSFTPSDNTPQSFISEDSKSRLVEISSDLHPRYEVTFGGKSAAHEPETVEAEGFIGKKGLAAKGRKVVERGEVKSVKFVEPLHRPEDNVLEIVGVEDVPEEAAPAPAVPSAPSEHEPIDIFEEPTLF